MKSDNGFIVVRLIELFYILSFFSITYTYNINIIFSIIIFFFLLKQKNTSNVYLIIILIIILCLPYAFLSDLRAAYRDLKTAIVFIPLFFLPLLKNTSYKLSNGFHLFMIVNAAIIYIDFILYFVLGKTIGNFTHTGGLPRPCGLIEDSNFYCYLTTIYIFFLFKTDKRLHKFYTISIILSGSISAICSLIILGAIYRKHRKNYSWNKWGIMGITIFVTYILVLCFASDIINYIKELDTAPFIKLKLHSMMNRLTVQSDAIHYIFQHGLVLGAGAGETINILGKGINLHNGYLQLLFEMGPILCAICFYMIYLCYKNLGCNYFVPLFICIFLLGNILEVIYFPLLSFILFISYADGQQRSIRFGFYRHLHKRTVYQHLA